MTGTTLWAGKHLTAEEEAALRGLVLMLRRTGNPAADNFARFLPEHDDRWSPDELELGAHAGPWLSFEARL